MCKGEVNACARVAGITLVEEVDGFHAGVLLVADLQLVELAEQIDQPLHHFHTLLTEPGTQREPSEPAHTHSLKHTQGWETADL